MIKEMFRKYPILDIAIGFIVILILQMFSSKDSMFDELIVNVGWCSIGNVSCLFTEHFLLILLVAIFSGIAQLSLDWMYKKNLFEKKKPISHNREDNNRANIIVTQYNSPNFLQANKAGITIKNNNDYGICLKARIITNIKFTEFFADGTEKTASFPLDKNNRIIGKTETSIDVKDAGEIFFVEVERNENVSLLLKKHLLLKSFYSVKSGDYEVNRAKWDFVFEIYGTIKGKPFKSEQFSASIEAFLQSYGEVNAHMSEIQTYPVPRK